MKAYEVKDLAIGCIYKCRLSGLHLLIERIPEKVVSTMQGDEVVKWKTGALYFNPITGSFTHVVPVDHQLIELG